VARGVVFVALLVWGAFTSASVSPPAAVLLVLVRSAAPLRCSRVAANVTEKCRILFACVVVQKLAGSKVAETGDLPSKEEMCALASSHRTRVGWMHTWSLALRSDAMCPSSA
jgi:hypothetical protein